MSQESGSFEIEITAIIRSMSQRTGLDGRDLKKAVHNALSQSIESCVRYGLPVNPENVLDLLTARERFLSHHPSYSDGEADSRLRFARWLYQHGRIGEEQDIDPRIRPLGERGLRGVVGEMNEKEARKKPPGRFWRKMH